MPNLVDNWTVDRSPGQGKTLLVSGIRTGIGGFTGIGQPSGGGSSTPPAGYASLMPAGVTLPPPGSSERAQFFGAFKAASGFDGKSVVGPFPSHVDANSWSFSGWFNFGVASVVGFNPNPIGFGPIIAIDGNPNLQSSLWPEQIVLPGTPQGFSFFYDTAAPNGAQFPMVGFTWPVDIGITVQKGWVHLMASIKFTVTSTLDCFATTIAYINDTPLVYTTLPTGLTDPPNSININFSGGNSYFGDNSAPSSGSGLYAGVTEIWEAPGHFVDWSSRATRYKFHTSDDAWGPLYTTFAPVNIGPTGSKALGFKPRAYLTGPPSLFNSNRAANGALLTLNGDALVLIDDLPG